MKEIMRIKRHISYLGIITVFLCSHLLAHPIFFEFKAAYFRPTDKRVRHIYGHGSALFGPELTFGVCEDSNWRGFVSLDFLFKRGHSIGLCDRTHMRIISFGLGAKYLVPFCCGDFYVGAGIQPIHLKTVNCSPFVTRKTAKWGSGGIFKIGSFIHLPHNLFIDLFIDYTLWRVQCDKHIICVEPLRVKLDGALFGIGLGYCFD